MTARRDGSCYGAAPDRIFIVSYTRTPNDDVWEYDADLSYNNLGQTFWLFKITTETGNCRNGFMNLISFGVPPKYLREIPWRVTDA